MFDKPNPQNSQVKENLEQIKLTQEKLNKIIEDLMTMIDALALNPSLLSRASDYWGTLHLWQKISLGSGLTVPFFIIGLLAQVTVLLTISIFTLITYAASSLLLDNHHEHNTDRTEHLKKGVASLADLLFAVILSLDKLHEQLANEIDKFHKENERLTININHLNEHTNKLNNQINSFIETEKNLRSIQEDLEQAAVTFKYTIKEQSDLLQQSQKDLAQAIHKYEQTEIELSAKIVELNNVKTEMGEQVDQVSKIAATLQGTIESLVECSFLNEEHRKVFLKKLDEFMTNKEASFILIADRICDAEHQLRNVTKELKDTQRELESYNVRFKELLAIQEAQIMQLKQQNETALSPATITHSPVTLLNKMGLHAYNVHDYPPLERPLETPLNTSVAAY